ncbi:MAG: 3-phosphoshikimate 1-carboxyvinyltransferase [Sphaerochaetaceae bacterium]
MDKLFHPFTPQGRIAVPGSKSQTIRAYLLASFARGKSTVIGALSSKDTLACRHMCEALGVVFFPDGDIMKIDSTQLHPRDRMSLDAENSGTSLYLTTGLAASLGVTVTFTGDEQLQKRPVGPLLDAYVRLGATITKHNGNFPPFSIKGPLRGGDCSISCPTSQYLSSLLFACPLAEGTSVIDVPFLAERPYVGLTLGWLKTEGIRLEATADWQHIVIPGGQSYKPLDMARIPGDWSSASFFLCMAAITGGPITVDGLDKEDAQGDKRILEILRTMGCTVQWNDGTVTVTREGALHGGTFDLNDIPDALPVLAATACYADEDVTFVNVEQARIKETDRIAVMHEELEKLGAVITERQDGMTIHRGHPLHGGICDGHEDHRIIMALATASIGLDGELIIRGIDAAGVTFPTFFTLLDSLGGA